MALRPATPIEPYEDLLPELDMVLIMTVEPGFGGQAFLDIMLPKIRRTRQLIDKHGLDLWLQVDGGVAPATIEACAEAGPTCSWPARRSTVRPTRRRPSARCVPRRRRRAPRRGGPASTEAASSADGGCVRVCVCV